MSAGSQPPASTFTRKEAVDKPGIIGARWWQESVATQLPRRNAMVGLLAFGGVLAGVAAIGTCVAAGSKSSSSSSSGGTGPDPDSEVKFEPRAALDMQKEYGWNFGATGESLVFDGQSTLPFDRNALYRMPEDLVPGDARLMPFYVPTLFQSPTALPRATPSGETATTTFSPLKDALVPIATAAMQTAFHQGQALASLLDKDARAKDLAVVVDLPGPEAVAFAAGASSVLDPVFLFDNWPHPRGVVPAHLTLAAATYYQPLLARARASRPKTARPMFVLDRKRLATYTDDATQFDNRHTARLPNASSLAGLGVKNVLHVSPNAIDRQELDDVVDDLLAWSAAKIALHVVPATAFEPPGAAPPASEGGAPAVATGDGGAAGASGGPYFYGGSPATHARFWTHWTAPASGLSTNEVQTYMPAPRTTPFSTGTAASGTRPRPANFGMVPVAIALGTGAILGAKLSRSGSWNRTNYGSSSS